MNIIGIIPARMGSSRFPGKPLAKISGIPMIGHVCFRSKMAKILNDVYVATPDKEIEEYCLKNNIKAVMTKDTHERASDRAAEALLKIENMTKRAVDIVVMIQGDEPMLYPQMIEESLKPLLADKDVNVVNLMAAVKPGVEHDDPNTIKVVVDENNFALYFSREPIPTRKRKAEGSALYKQVCIIPFRRDFLLKFNQLSSMPLEIAESVDMLRVLEHGFKVKMALSDFKTYSVDTAEDLKKVDQIMAKDPLFKEYGCLVQQSLKRQII